MTFYLRLQAITPIRYDRVGKTLSSEKTHLDYAAYFDVGEAVACSRRYVCRLGCVGTPHVNDGSGQSAKTEDAGADW